MGNKLRDKMFRIAEDVAALSNFPRIQIGAVIARKNSILSVGLNQTKSHPIQKHYNKNRKFRTEDTCEHFLHAEMDAITKLKNKEDLAKAVIYVFRKNLNGEYAMSRPCAACMKRIIDVGIRKICYTTDQGYAYEHIQ